MLGKSAVDIAALLNRATRVQQHAGAAYPCDMGSWVTLLKEQGAWPAQACCTAALKTAVAHRVAADRVNCKLAGRTYGAMTAIYGVDAQVLAVRA